MAQKTKLKELILYCSKRMEEDQHVGRGRVKLAKLLWRSDFGAYWKFGEPITETQYHADQFGPSPVDELLAARDLESEGRLEFRNEWDRQQIPIALKDPNLEVFSAAQIALVDDQLHKYQFVTGQVMIDEAHEFPGWQLTWRDGKGQHNPIPFESVFWDIRTELEKWEQAEARVLAERLGISS
jgi:antitoxin SocA-like protein